MGVHRFANYLAKSLKLHGKSMLHIKTNYIETEISRYQHQSLATIFPIGQLMTFFMCLLNKV